MGFYRLKRFLPRLPDLAPSELREVKFGDDREPPENVEKTNAAKKRRLILRRADKIADGLGVEYAEKRRVARV